MNKAYELEQLRKMLIDPELLSGLYLLDTDLSDEEIEDFIKSSGCCSYIKESLLPTEGRSVFELFVTGLSYQCTGNSEIQDLRHLLITAEADRRDIIIYNLLIQMMKHLCMSGRTIIHVHGEFDLMSLTHEDLYKLKEALAHHKDIIIVASKKKCHEGDRREPLLTTVVCKKQNNRYMENRLDKVHVSYKNDDAYEDALNAVLAGLKKNNIPYSIDKYDILYKDNIDDYEKEIGVADRVVMFVIPKYFESLDCMYEMTQMFKNGHVKERIFPLVDMEGTSRDGDGLTKIKDFWQNEKIRKSERIKTEPGGSTFLLMEIQKIDDIINTLDQLWLFICRNSTGNYNKLIANDAALLINELKKTLPTAKAQIDEKFIPSRENQPTVVKRITQNGKQSVYVENNMGSIIIN